MINLSPKLKLLVILASVLVAAIIVTVITVVVLQKTNVAKVKTVSFHAASVNLNVGETVELSVEITPDDAKNKQIEFSVGNSQLVEIVSETQTSVIIKAKKIGETQIFVKSLANKNLVDQCVVRIVDTIADDISVGDMMIGEVGMETKIPLLVEPLSANLQKIIVVDYDKNYFEYVNISIEDNNAFLIVCPKLVGTSSIVLGVDAETENGEKIVNTKLFMFNSYLAEIDKITYMVSSSQFTEMTPSNLIDNNKLILKSNYKLYFRFYGDSLFENSINLTNIIYDNSLISVVQEANGQYVISSFSSDWETTSLRIEYGEKTLIINLYYFDLEQNPDFNNALQLSDTVVQNQYNLISINSQNIKVLNLMKYGFVSLEINNADVNNVVYDNMTFAVTSSEESFLNIEFLFIIDYWDKACITGSSAIGSYQINKRIQVIPVSFEE